jgi:hypothetical protein
MHDLLIVIKTCAVYQVGVGRRELRPGTIVNLEPALAESLVKKGYLERVATAAPLFVQATDPPKKPMRKPKERKPDGG